MKTLYKLTLLILFLFTGNFANAFSAIGGDIAWECLGNDKYKITVTVYKDCNSTNLSNIRINFNGTCMGLNPSTQTMSSGRDITPVCPGQCSRCDSRGCSFQYGVEEYKLTTTLDVANYKKNGCCDVTISWTQCCRSGAITTGAANQRFYIEGKMNVCQSPCDNSPIFNSSPINILCLAQEIGMSAGAHDIDTVNGRGDSLVHSLVNPLASRNSTTSWSNSFSAQKPLSYLGFPNTYPLSRFPSGFHLDSSSGTLLFVPTKLERTVVAVKVEEYRKGKKIGEITRDIQLIIIKCPNNNPPVLSGEQCKKPSIENFDIYACVEQPLSVNICSSDKDVQDTVRLTCEHSIPGATYSLAGLKKDALTFSWTPQKSHIRKAPYRFVVRAKDNACPVPGRSERVYSIYVGDSTPFRIYTNLKPINAKCGEFWVKARTVDKVPSREWNWYLNDTVLLHSSSSISPRDSFKYTFDSNGIYNIKIESKRTGCFETFRRTINMMGLKPIQLTQIADTSLCRKKRLKTQITATGGHGQLKYSWMTSDGVSSGTSDNIDVVLREPSAGSIYTRRINYAIIDSAGCSARSDFKVLVKRKYDLELMSDTLLCGGDLDTLLPVKLDTNLQGIWSGDGINQGRFSSKGLSRKLYKLEYFAENDRQCILDTADIGVHALPTVNAGPNINGCPNMLPRALNGLPKGGQWSGLHLVGNQFTPPKNISGSYTFVYAIIDSKGCVATDTTKLTVLPYVAQIDAGRDTFLCEKTGLFQLTPSPSTGKWRGFNLETKNGSTFFNSAFATVGRSYPLIFDGYDSIGCMNSDTLNISMKPLPNVDAGINLDHCFSGPKDEVQLQGTPAEGTWLGAATANASQKLAIDSSHLGTSTYTYKFTDKIGCSNSDELVLTIKKRPEVYAGNDDTVCLSKTRYFHLIGAPKDGVWNGPGILNQPSVSKVLLQNSAIGKRTYIFSYQDSKGCPNADSMNVYVGTGNNALFTPSTKLGKAPLTVNFTDESIDATSHFWNFGNGETSSDVEPTVTYQSEGIYYVSLSTMDKRGFCESTHRDTIVVDGNIGVQRLPNHAITMYPNPTQGQLYLVSNATTELDVEILNAAGRTMYTAQMKEQLVLNLNEWPNGLYLVKAQTENGFTWVSKLQVE